MSDFQDEPKDKKSKNQEEKKPYQPFGGMPWGGGGGKNNLRRWLPLLILIALIALPWIFGWFSLGGGRTKVSYSFFLTQLEQNNVESVLIKGEEIQGTLKTETTSPAPGDSGGGEGVKQFTTYYPNKVGPDLLERLKDENLTIYTRPESEGGIGRILLNLLPMLILFYLIFSFARRMRNQGGGAGGLFNIGKSRAKRYEKKEHEATTFDDIAGIESAKEELQEVVEFLENPDKFQSFGAKTPKGVLLVGPPGTGKTLLARAVAGEAEVPFFSISGSDFMEMFVGVGASRVRNLFQDAKKVQPSIIFVDELDSIGRHRGAGLGGGHDEREQTLNQLLSELDGFERNESTIIIAATNRPDILDPALLRPGRFDRRVTTNLPPKKDRFEILKIHARNKILSESADLDKLAGSTPGFSGADLENLLNEAALVAVRHGKEKIEQDDLDKARDKIILGLERKSVVLSEEEKKIISYHESGHAVVAAVLPHSDPVQKVSIIPRENSMGATQQLPEEDKYLYDSAYLEDRLAVMMGGRAAEKLLADTVTSGAENDLKEAQKLARKMVLDWGMSATVENIAMGSQRRNVFLGEQIGEQKEYSEETSRKIDEAVQEILSRAYGRASSTLKEKRQALDKVVSTLYEEEEILGDDIYKILESND
jgi:cell division protease FtsH